jgi:Transposase DDE domain
MSKDAFERELMRRSPLANSVLSLYDFAFDDALLASIWDEHRGRCYEDKLKFEDMLCLTRNALVRCGGSAHKLFLELESQEQQPIDESNFYRKLRNTPTAVSRALLLRCTMRLSDLLPVAVVRLPGCFDDFRVVIGDGKVIKRVTGKLKPARGYSGSFLGAKAVVGLDARTGLALAFSDSLDGMSNDVPLVPALMPQLYQAVGDQPMLSVWDRAFDDPRTLGHLSSRPGDTFVARTKQKKNAVFVVESATESHDQKGRRILDEIGVLGTGKQKMRLRRITLFRNPSEQEEDVVLLTNLMDRKRYSAADILELYRHRWGIEHVFQQVTQTFSLEHLIGCSPKATLFQFSFCLLLYNLMQVIKAYVADDGKVLASIVSMYYLFDDVRKELHAWAYHTDGTWPRVQRSADQVREHLRTLLRDSWNPIKYTKAADKKPRGKPAPKQLLHGGHSSMQRVLEGKAKVLTR